MDIYEISYLGVLLNCFELKVIEKDKTHFIPNNIFPISFAVFEVIKQKQAKAPELLRYAFIS
jgi:hypothetical protein